MCSQGQTEYTMLSRKGYVHQRDVHTIIRYNIEKDKIIQLIKTKSKNHMYGVKC